MSATAQALATSIYDALDESGILRELDNEQVWAVAELAAQAIEAAGIIATAIPEGHAKLDGRIVKMVAVCAAFHDREMGLPLCLPLPEPGQRPAGFVLYRIREVSS